MPWQKHILKIEDGGYSSSSGDEIEVEDSKEHERKRVRVQALMKEKRRMVAQRRRRGMQAKPVMELDVDSETDEDEDEAVAVDPTYGLGEQRVGQIMKLFNLVDCNGNGSIDSYELSVFATSFFRHLKDPVLRDEAESMMEEVDIDKNGRIDKDEYLSYFSLVTGLMEDEEFTAIYSDLLESFEGQSVNEGQGMEEFPGERLVKLQLLFQGWDPKNTGAVPKDVLFVLARACEQYTEKEAGSVVKEVAEAVSRKDFIQACLHIGLHKMKDTDFDVVIDPLLEKRL